MVSDNDSTMPRVEWTFKINPMPATVDHGAVEFAPAWTAWQPHHREKLGFLRPKVDSPFRFSAVAVQSALKTIGQILPKWKFLTEI